MNERIIDAQGTAFLIDRFDEKFQTLWLHDLTCLARVGISSINFLLMTALSQGGCSIPCLTLKHKEVKKGRRREWY